MIATHLLTPVEVAQQLAEAAKAKRLALNLSQQTLSERSGVRLGTLKKFEQIGIISLKSLLQIALALGCLNDFSPLFKADPPQQFATLDTLLKQKKRTRGRE